MPVVAARAVQEGAAAAPKAEAVVAIQAGIWVAGIRRVVGTRDEMPVVAVVVASLPPATVGAALYATDAGIAPARASSSFQTLRASSTVHAPARAVGFPENRHGSATPQL